MNKSLSIKYKPNNFDDFNISNFTKKLLNSYIDNNYLKIIIHGSISSGKSELIKVILDKLKVNYNNILNISLLKEQGINFYKNDLKNFCETAIYNKKIIIIDDIDYYNENIQNIFYTLISKYKNINFIISVTNIYKVNNNIKDILNLITIETITYDYLKNIINNIIEKEKIICNNYHIDYIIKVSNYYIPNVINFLQKIILINKNLNNIEISKLESNIIINNFKIYIDYCMNKEFHCAINYLLDIYNTGYSVIDILENLINYIKFYENNLKEENKYIIIKIIIKYMNIFNDVHEYKIELIFMTNNIIYSLE